MTHSTIGLRPLALVRGAACALVAAMAATMPAHAGDAAAGKAIFTAQCSVCHTITSGGANGVGPNLFGVAGRPAGSVKGYSYTPAMKHAGFSWTDEKLAAYVTMPSQLVPGNKMPYAGLRPASRVADLVAHLDTAK